MFKPTPDTTFQQLIDQMMLAFCEAYTQCCNGEPRRVIIETDNVLPKETQWNECCYYMLDFTNDYGMPLVDIVDGKPVRSVIVLSCSDGTSQDAATYTQAVKLLEDLAQKEQKHITEVYVETF